MLKVSGGIWGQGQDKVTSVHMDWLTLLIGQVNLPSGLTWNVWPASPEAGVYSQEDNSDVLPGNGHKV